MRSACALTRRWAATPTPALTETLPLPLTPTLTPTPTPDPSPNSHQVGGDRPGLTVAMFVRRANLRNKDDVLFKIGSVRVG